MMRWLRIGALRKVLDLDLDRINLPDSLAPKDFSEGFLLANRADVDPPPSSKKYYATISPPLKFSLLFLLALSLFPRACLQTT